MNKEITYEYDKNWGGAYEVVNESYVPLNSNVISYQLVY